MEAVRDAEPATGRAWLVVNPSRRNAVGQPTGSKSHLERTWLGLSRTRAQVCLDVPDSFGTTYGSQPMDHSLRSGTAVCGCRIYQSKPRSLTGLSNGSNVITRSIIR